MVAEAKWRHLVTLSEVSRGYGVPHDTVRRWVEAGSLPATRRNGESGQYLVDPARVGPLVIRYRQNCARGAAGKAKPRNTHPRPRSKPKARPEPVPAEVADPIRQVQLARFLTDGDRAEIARRRAKFERLRGASCVS